MSHDRLRILHVSEVHWGGVVSLLDHFVPQQVGSGHEVHVLAPSSMPTWPGAQHHRWDVERAHPRTAVWALHELRRTVRTVQPDVMHLHSFVAGLLGRLPGMPTAHDHVPVVYQPHAWSTDLFTVPALAWAVRTAERAAAPRTDLLVANCHDEVVAGTRFGVELPSRELGVAVDLERFQPIPEAERRRQREALGIDAEHVVLVLGRIAHQKGQDLLVPAWEHHRPEHALLALVGPGDTRSLVSLAPTQWGRTIRAAGEAKDVRSWLWAADVLVLSSRYETVALAVAEAMATGLPVVATAVDGVPGVLAGGHLPRAGSVVGVGDMSSLLRETSRRLQDRDLWRRESHAARLRAEQFFRPEVVAQRLERAYRDAIEMSWARAS